MSFQIKRVLISEPVDASCATILKNHGIEVVTKTGLSKSELLQEIQNYDGLVVRSATKVTADVIEAGKQLKVIGRAGTGVDNIDCTAATRCGVLVLNAPGGNTMSAAELTCGMIVSLSRNIPEACASLKSGKWDRKNFMGSELQGKTLAIVGLGRIGREVASRMQAFGMRTIGFDPLVPAEESVKFGVESMELEKIWPQADYVTVHVPLIPQTKGLVNAAVFAKCKPGIKIINCARGGIVDEADLVTALESGQCGGAGLDVYTEEPPKHTALIHHPKVICLPHLGASTEEAQTRVAEEIADQFVDLMNGKFVLGVVNSPAFCHSLAAENHTWVKLCQMLGAITGSFVNGTKESITVALNLHGDCLAKKQNVMKVAALVGILKQLKYENANFVNAPVLAQDEAHIQVSAVNTASSGDSQYPNSVMVGVNIGNTSHNVVGSVYGQEAYLIAIDGTGFPSPVLLQNNLILCRGDHNPKMTIEVLGALVESGEINSVHWSTVKDEKSWCVIKGNVSAEETLKNLGGIVDFWAQLSI